MFRNSFSFLSAAVLAVTVMQGFPTVSAAAGAGEVNSVAARQLPAAALDLVKSIENAQAKQNKSSPLDVGGSTIPISEAPVAARQLPAAALELLNLVEHAGGKQNSSSPHESGNSTTSVSIAPSQTSAAALDNLREELATSTQLLHATPIKTSDAPKSTHSYNNHIVIGNMQLGRRGLNMPLVGEAVGALEPTPSHANRASSATTLTTMTTVDEPSARFTSAIHTPTVEGEDDLTAADYGSATSSSIVQAKVTQPASNATNSDYDAK